MLNLIDQIIEIDKDARNKVDTAHAEAASIINQGKKETQQIKSEYDERISTRLEKIEQDYNKIANGEIGLINAEKDKKIESLVAVMEEHRKTWEDEILLRITG